MDSSQVKAAFIRLKPLCDAFLSAPSKSTLNNLVKECKGLKPCILQEVHAYILFPFTVHLRKYQEIKSPELRASMVQVVNDIFSKTRVDSVEMYFKYFYLMIVQIFDFANIQKTNKSSNDFLDPAQIGTLDEDFTLCVVRTITTLTLRIPRDVRLNLYSRSNAAKLGQGIYVCVQIARKLQYKTLRLESMQCILSICTLHDDLMDELHTPTFDAKLSETVGDVLMFFLPGLLASMQEIAKGDHTQPHAITCLALKTLSRVLCLTMMDRKDESRPFVTNDDFLKLVESRRVDDENVQEKPDPFGLTLRSKGVEGMKKHLEKAERNQDWYDAAGEKLTLVMKSLLSVQFHPHEKVRKEAALMCSNIVDYCPKNMYPSMQYVLEMLIASLEDSSVEVSNIGKEALKKFTANTVQNSNKRLLDILEDNFGTVLTKLPRYLNKLDADLQLCGIRLFKGYIRLMTSSDSSPQRLTQILSCAYVMNKFAIILVEMFKLDCSNVQSLEKCTVKDVETMPGGVPTTYMWNINYANLLNDECIASAVDVWKIIGTSEALEIIVDYFLEQYRLNNECRKEIIHILVEILTASHKSNPRTEHLIKDVINTYIDNDNWYLPISVQKTERIRNKSDTLDITIYDPNEPIRTQTYGLYEGATETRYMGIRYGSSENDINGDTNENNSEKHCETLAQAKNNIIEVCLMTEGIGKIAKYLGENFQPYLLKTLYLILERAGSNVEMIYVSGLKALNDIAEAFQLKSISELVGNNTDYFTHHINMKLKKMSVNPEVLDVLLIVMRYSEVDVLMCLYNIVSSVLDQTHKSNTMGNSVLLLKLFYAFTMHIKSKFDTEAEPAKEVPKRKRKLSNLKCKFNSVLFNLREYEKNLNIIDNIQNFDENYTSECNGVHYNEEHCEQNEEKKVVPTHISMVVSVLKKSLNYLPSNDLAQKLLAMEIIKEGIYIIRDWEDELLPLVHQVWAPLVCRFKESSQPMVINKALSVLFVLAKTSRDFIRNRTIEDVIPALCDFLTRTAKESSMKDVGSSYRFTQSYKLQLAILEEVCEIAVWLNVHERVVYNIVHAAQPYLNCKQPRPLQVACMDAFKLLGMFNYGVVWSHLIGLAADEQVEARFQSLKSSNVEPFVGSVADHTEAIDYKANVCALLEYLKNKNEM